MIIQLTSSIYYFNESDTSPQVCIEILQGVVSSASAEVNVRSTDISAKCKSTAGLYFYFLFVISITYVTAPDDYLPVITSVTIPIGSTVGDPPECIDLTIVDDSTVEITEVFSIGLSVGDPSVSISEDSALVNILDNDGI